MDGAAKWTFMVYLAGNNNLSDAGDEDLREMRSIGSTPDVNVVVEFDNAGQDGTRRYRLARDGADEAEKEEMEQLPETDSGAPQTLADFLEWATTKYPAERYALVLWNHGGGWEPTEMDRVARSVRPVDYSAREAGERAATRMGRVLFRSTLETIFTLPSPRERAICSDDGSGHSLDTVELGKVLAEAVEKLGRPLDLLGMDACLMANLEVAYQVQPYVQYIVASEELEPNEGWPYDEVLRATTENPDMPTPELASHIVAAYVKSYVDRRYGSPVTQAALNPAHIQTVVEPLDRLAEVLAAAMPDASMELWSAQRRSARFFKNTLWDVADLCTELEQNSTNADARQAAADVRAALQPGPDRFILAEAHNGDAVARCGGVTIYLLPPLTDVSRYYADLEFAKNHRWLAMLEAYHAS